MSDVTARNFLESINRNPSFIAERYVSSGELEGGATMLISDLRMLATADVAKMQAQDKVVARRTELLAAYGLPFDTSSQSKDFAFSNGVAIIPIHGTLINRFPYSWGFVTGYAFIRNQLALIKNDPDVKAIVYDVNSGGGGVTGLAETAAQIQAMSKKSGGIPSLAMIDANCFSAAYYAACGADKMVITPSGGAGSIGTMAMHVDISGVFAKEGAKITLIYSGAHKVDGSPYAALSPDALKRTQQECDDLRQEFAQFVSDNRKSVTLQGALDTEAQCYYAKEALSLGLVDSIAPPDVALESFFNDPNADIEDVDPIDPQAQQEQISMTDAEIAAANQKAANDAKTAERNRIKEITGHAEAKGREKQAEFLAYNTDMSVEDCVKHLAASERKAEPAAAQEQQASSAQQQVSGTKPNNPFEGAMNATSGKNVSADQDMTSGELNADGTQRPKTLAERLHPKQFREQYCTH